MDIVADKWRNENRKRHETIDREIILKLIDNNAFTIHFQPIFSAVSKLP